MGSEMCIRDSFKTIGRVEGSGTTYTPTSYNFLHKSPVIGDNYYRLKQVDDTGRASYSWVVTQRYTSLEDGTEIDVFPNPNSGEFMIALPDLSNDTDALIRIIDAKGAVVSETIASLSKGQITHPITAKGLPEGIYHLSLTLMSGKNTYNKSFMIR